MNNLAEKTLRSRPRWLDEEPAILDLLDRFLHKLENGHRLTLRINSKSFPDLYAPYEDQQYLWSLLKTLNNEYHILSIRYARNKPYQETFENAQIVFNPEKEELVRDWLNRPALDPYALVWQETLHKLKSSFEDHGQALSEEMVRLPDRGPEQTLRAFARLGGELQKPITLRALSARCFWGDSKFLDKREELVRKLFPNASSNLRSKPILVCVHLTAPIEQVLFVENQDSFLSLAEQNLDGFALVYSAGFHAGSKRIRSRDSVVFSHLNTTNSVENLKLFESWWFHDVASLRLRARFWGDLDFAGMTLLRALKAQFPEVTAWKTGYVPLLDRLERGLGHDQESSGKERQKDPELTGDEYADLELLPALRDSGEFVDQEAVLCDELTLS